MSRKVRRQGALYQLRRAAIAYAAAQHDDAMDVIDRAVLHADLESAAIEYAKRGRV